MPKSILAPRGLLLAAFTLALCVRSVAAAEWAIDAAASLRSEHASNPRLLESPSGGATGLVADANARFGRQLEDSRLEVVPRLVVRQFSGDYAMSGIDYGLAAAYVRATERRKFTLSFDYLSDDASTSGFDNAGYFEDEVPRQTIAAGAEITTNLSERATLLLRFEPQAVRFDAPPDVGLVDYDYLPLLGYLQREVSPRLRLRLIARAAFLEATDTRAESREFGGGVGMDFSLSERWKTSIDVGPTWLAQGDDSYASGASYRFSLVAAWPRTEISVAASQVSSPTAGRGVFETRVDGDFGARHALTERWSLRGGASHSRYAADRGAAGATEDRTYSRAYGGIDWLATERLLVQLQVAQERQEAAQDGSGTRVSLGMTWNGRLAAVSR